MKGFDQIQTFLNGIIYTNENVDIRVENIVKALLLFIFFRILVFVINKILLSPYFKRKMVDKGTQFALLQLIKYFIYVFAIVTIIRALGFRVTFFLAGSAALLVGVGLGLQQTFNDLLSGIILLVEGSVQQNDVIEVGTLVGKVQKIGVRTSLIVTRDSISIIVPNSKITNDNVINWSHASPLRMFSLKIGVAYGSDTRLVKQTLIECAESHPKVSNIRKVSVRFNDFNDSSLDFSVLFWTTEFMEIENIKSDLRFSIDDAFRKHKITIPFPQRHLHIEDQKLPSHSSDIQVQNQDSQV